MKAILVIDVPYIDKKQINYLSVSFGGISHYIGRDHMAIKPMPKEFSITKLSEDEQDSTKMLVETAIMKVYADGWNDCLKEINETKKTT